MARTLAAAASQMSRVPNCNAALHMLRPEKQCICKLDANACIAVQRCIVAVTS